MSQEQSVWRLSELGKGPTALKQHREPVPSPGPGQYLVRIHSVSLNFRDVVIVNGGYGPEIVEGLVPGSDMAGEIVSAGEVRFVTPATAPATPLANSAAIARVQISSW